MPQEAQGNISYSQNPSGTGAVYFDRVADPLSVHLDNLKMLDEGEQRRAAERQQKAAIARGLLNDIDPSTSSVFDTDGDYFKGKSDKIIGDYADLLSKGVDPTSPDGQAAYMNVKKQLTGLKWEAEANKTGKDAWMKATDEYSKAPQKFQQESLANLAAFRAAHPADRAKMDVNSLLIPKLSDLPTVTMNKVLKNQKLDLTTSRVKNPDGSYADVKVETYAPERLKGLAYSSYGDSDVSYAVDEEYNKIDPIKQRAYEQQAQIESQATGNTIAPQQVFYNDYLSSRNPRRESQSAGQFSPMQRAYASQWGKNVDDEQSVKYVVDAVEKMNSDDPNFWTSAAADGMHPAAAGYAQSAFGITVPPQEVVQFSNALNGLKLSNAVVKTKKTDTYGEVKDAQGRNIYEYKTVPNEVLNIRKQGGKTYLQTYESMIKEEQGEGDGWEEVNDRTIDKLVTGFKDPIKATAMLRKELISRKAYPNQNVKLKDPSKPQVGDERPVQGGTAVWDGTKWKMK